MRTITLEEMIELSPDYSTTRLVTRERLVIEEPPDAAFETVLFLPEGEGRQGEGGLRTQGYFKRSLPEKPLITVITVVFNGAQHLEETILSVVGQTYDNVEYIIIDGGSTDGTLDIIRKYEHAIDYWVSERDGGIYHAMNKGIENSYGDYYIILGSDDFFYKESIDNFKNEIIKKPADLIVADVDTKDGKVQIKRNFPWLYVSKSYITSHSVGTLIKKSLHNEFGYYSLKFPVAADAFFIKKICQSNKKICLASFSSGYFSTNGISNQDVLAILTDILRIQILTEKYKILQIALFFIRIIIHYKKL